jgi:glycosyltransferase involved in cell wall biosynthesis
MTAPLTIIIPVRNREQYVERTLDSIAASTCPFVELLIVDNGSVDRSVEICQQWARAHQDLPVRILTETRPGAAVARNCGLRAARSEFVYFFDSDDIFSDDFVATILPALSPSSDVLCIPVRQEVNDVCVTRPYRPCADVHVHLLNSMLSTLSMVFRRDFLLQIGGWNETLTTWDDWELGVRVLLAHPRVRWLEGQSFHHVIVHPESLTGISFSATLPAIQKAMCAVLQLLQQAPPKDKILSRALVSFYFRCIIFAGFLCREKNRDGEEWFLSLAHKSLNSKSLTLRITASLLQKYVAVGGRGAWRIALWITDKL